MKVARIYCSNLDEVMMVDTPKALVSTLKTLIGDGNDFSHLMGKRISITFQSVSERQWDTFDYYDDEFLEQFRD